MVTEYGKQTFDLVNSYNLGGFYQWRMGNLIIEPRQMTVDVVNDILRFLSENTDWVMGYEDIGNYEQSIYVTRIDNLQ